MIFYLHGFGSSARSSKAAFFATKLRELGIELQTPDFNEPDFSTLTIGRMIGQVSAAIDGVPPASVTLIGSSLGAFVAVQTALQRLEQIDRLILLAPALDLNSGPPGDRSLDEWKRTNRLEVFHHGYGRVMPVHYELYADACRYDCMGAVLPMPIQIFQGRRDTAVDPERVERWAGARSNVELHLLDDDHQLGASLDYMWREMKRFLELAPARPYV